ncbi:MAG: cytochrome c3 family protein [Thermodesulfovibrionales bacterium]|nr:cytochrome c3 family protein [Thermodesulfovibrionales bacterium]
MSDTVLAGVSTTKHNLSVTGPGVVKAVNQTEVCTFCHTPHNASPQAPLWNHEISSFENYTNYYSDTLKAYPPGGAPPIDGFSKLCLSCHDGTIGVGATIGTKGTIEMDTVANVIESGRLRPGSPGYLGTDLSGGHPISFIFDETLVSLRNAEEDIMHLNWPILDQDVKLYPTQGGYGVQCTSCHEPHGGKGGPGEPPFWRKAAYDDVCLVCHDISSQIGH